MMRKMMIRIMRRVRIIMMRIKMMRRIRIKDMI